MTAAKVRVTKTEVVLDTVPLGARHWVAFAALVTLGVGSWWAFYGRLPTAAPNPSEQVWFAHKGDDLARAEAISRSSAAKQAAVIAVGSSVVLENLSPDEQLSSASGVRVVNLATSGQSVMESLYILHRQGIHAGQLVLVSVTPNEMAQPADIADERLASGLWIHPPIEFAEAFRHDIPKLESWITPTARRSLVLSTQRQLLYRRVRGGIHQWAARHLYGDDRPLYTQYRHDHETAGDLKQQERLRRYLQTGLHARFEENRAHNAQILGVLLRYIKSRGAQVVVVDPPRIHGDSLVTYGKYWAPFRADVKTVTDSTGVVFLDLNPALRFTTDEFHDPVHLAPAGRARWSAAITEFIASRCGARAGRASGGCS